MRRGQTVYKGGQTLYKEGDRHYIRGVQTEYEKGTDGI